MSIHESNSVRSIWPLLIAGAFLLAPLAGCDEDGPVQVDTADTGEPEPEPEPEPELAQSCAELKRQAPSAGDGVATLEVEGRALEV